MSEDREEGTEEIIEETINALNVDADNSAEYESGKLRQRNISTPQPTEAIHPEITVKLPTTSTTTPSFGPNVNQIKTAVQSKVNDYKNNPKQIFPDLRSQLNSQFSSQALLYVFFIIWLPFLIMISGSLVGQLVKLFFRNFHYCVGAGAAIYVGLLQKSDKPATQRFLQTFLIASVVPIFMVEESSFLLRVFTLIAFAGTPLVYVLILKEKSDKEPPTKEENLLLYATAPAVIFALAIGGAGYFNTIVLCLVFAAAAYGSQFLFPTIVGLIPPQQKEIIRPHEILIFAVLEILIANVILMIFSLIFIPQATLDSQHGFFLNILITILGFVFLAGSHLIASGFLQKSGLVPAATLALIEKIYLGLIALSYASILFTAALQHWFMRTVVGAAVERMVELET